MEGRKGMTGLVGETYIWLYKWDAQCWVPARSLLAIEINYGQRIERGRLAAMQRCRSSDHHTLHSKCDIDRNPTPFWQMESREKVIDWAWRNAGFYTTASYRGVLNLEIFQVRTMEYSVLCANLYRVQPSCPSLEYHSERFLLIDWVCRNTQQWCRLRVIGGINMNWLEYGRL